MFDRVLNTCLKHINNTALIELSDIEAESPSDTIFE